LPRNVPLLTMPLMFVLGLSLGWVLASFIKSPEPPATWSEILAETPLGRKLQKRVHEMMNMGMSRAEAQNQAWSPDDIWSYVHIEINHAMDSFKSIGVGYEEAWEFAWSRMMGTTPQEFHRRWGDQAAAEMTRTLGFKNRDWEARNKESAASLEHLQQSPEEDQRLIETETSKH